MKTHRKQEKNRMYDVFLILAKRILNVVW